MVTVWYILSQLKLTLCLCMKIRVTFKNILHNNLASSCSLIYKPRQAVPKSGHRFHERFSPLDICTGYILCLWFTAGVNLSSLETQDHLPVSLTRICENSLNLVITIRWYSGIVFSVILYIECTSNRGLTESRYFDSLVPAWPVQ